MNFYCLKQSLSCPVNMIGQPDCENCEYYADCSVCGRKGTSCENCKDMLTCATCEYNVFDSKNNRCAKCVDCSNHSAKEESNERKET